MTAEPLEGHSIKNSEGSLPVPRDAFVGALPHVVSSLDYRDAGRSAGYAANIRDDCTEDGQHGAEAEPAC